MIIKNNRAMNELLRSRATGNTFRVLDGDSATFNAKVREAAANQVEHKPDAPVSADNFDMTAALRDMAREAKAKK